MTASAAALALHPTTLGAWLGHRDESTTAHRAESASAPELAALVPVEIVERTLAACTAVTLVSPSGYRLEGLTLDDALHALARLR
jgi:hypothetical protein